MTSTE
jgi:hypothetical protein